MNPSAGNQREKSEELPAEFARLVVNGVREILAWQRADGAIAGPAKLSQWDQQAIFPMAFCWAGLDPEQKLKNSPEVAAAIAKLGDFLVSVFNDKGQLVWGKEDVYHVDQRLTYAWVEALRILRDAGGSFEFDRWSDKIIRACEHLIHRLEKLVGVRRFIVRIQGTGTNHVALYLSTIYRAGKVLNRPDFCEFALPMIRALAQDVHPDGYWEEHSDVQRSGGPTIMYNYLTNTAIALMHAWTGEAVFASALEKSTRLYCNFVYPDGTYFDVIDERVRYDRRPFIWSLFGLTGSAEGRGSAMIHLSGWKREMERNKYFYGEDLARHCENYLYWQPGEIATPPFAQANNEARLTLPAAVFKRGPWCIGLSCMRATTPEDKAYDPNAFALERQKLFSVWHERIGLLIDGSNGKFQPENSTFYSLVGQAPDYWPCGGEVAGKDGMFTAKAAYKAFYGRVDIRTPSKDEARIALSIDPVCSRGPITAGFTVVQVANFITTFAGKTIALGGNAFQFSAAELGGGFHIGAASITLPPSAALHWPFSPYFSYTPDHKSLPGAWRLRVAIELDIDKREAEFAVKVS